MTSQEILRADVLDILFEHRNKDYGAYELRRLYPKRLTTAVLSSISIVGGMLLFLSPQYGKVATPVVSIIDYPIVVSTYSIPPETPPPPPQKRQSHSVGPAQVPQVTFRFEEDHKATDIPEQGGAVGRIHAGTISDGAPAASTQVPAPAAGMHQPPLAPEPFVPSYLPPEFPGGLSAWMHFLNRNLRVPESLAPGEKRSVVVRFLVGADGSVSGFDVVQSAGVEFDAEVIRVLRKMPEWKPAVQNGQPVALTFTQPVTFIGVEE